MPNLKVNEMDSHLSWIATQKSAQCLVHGLRGLADHTNFEDQEIGFLELLYFVSIDDGVHHGVSVGGRIPRYSTVCGTCPSK